MTAPPTDTEALCAAAEDASAEDADEKLIERLHWEAHNAGLPPFDGWGWLDKAADRIAELRAEVVRLNEQNDAYTHTLVLAHANLVEERHALVMEGRKYQMRVETLESARQVQDAALAVMRNDFRECAERAEAAEAERDRLRKILKIFNIPSNDV